MRSGSLLTMCADNMCIHCELRSDQMIMYIHKCKSDLVIEFLYDPINLKTSHQSSVILVGMA